MKWFIHHLAERHSRHSWVSVTEKKVIRKADQKIIAEIHRKA